MNRPRKQITILVVVSALLIIGAMSYSYITSFQRITVRTSQDATGSTVKIYKKEADQQPVAENIGLDTETKLKKGIYVVEFSGSDYEKQRIDVTLGESPQTVVITPRYSQNKLGDMFSAEKPDIYRVIHREIPQTTDNFEISEGKLYQLGEWFGGKIHQRQTSEEERQGYIDTFRVVLKKENGEWKIVTDPPEIIISHVKYPDIPRDILVDLNKNPEPKV